MASEKKRVIRYSLYFWALVVSLALFASGIFLGVSLENQNLQSISDRINTIESGANELESFYIVGEDPALCPVYTEELVKLDEKTAELGYELAYFEEQKGFVDSGLKKKYFALEGVTLLLSQNMKEKCDQNFSIIVYFYSNPPCPDCAKTCPDCEQQGYELLEVKKELQAGVRIYSFDGDLNSTVANSFKAKYGVFAYPSIVINGQPAVSGLKTKQWVLDRIRADQNAAPKNAG